MRSKTQRLNFPKWAGYIMKHGKKMDVYEMNIPIQGSHHLVYDFELVMPDGTIKVYPGMSETWNGLRKSGEKILCIGRPFTHRGDDLDKALKECKSAKCKLYYVEEGCARDYEMKLIWEHFDAGHVFINKRLYLSCR